MKIVFGNIFTSKSAPQNTILLELLKTGHQAHDRRDVTSVVETIISLLCMKEAWEFDFE